MRVDFTGRQMEVTPDLRQYTEKRLKTLGRFFRNGCTTHVILIAEKHRRTAEITLKVRDHTLVGVSETADARLSISGALDRLKRQVVRLVQKRRSRKRRPKPTTSVVFNVLQTGRPNPEEHRVLETEKIPIKPLTVDEAVATLDSNHRGMVIFRNMVTERVNVLYRRDDGNLGLIEPEQ